MATIKPEPVKLICAVTCSPSVDLEKVHNKITAEFGTIESLSETIKFDYTDYYQPEMGKNLQKYLISFESLIEPETLWKIKNQTIAIESDFREGSKRTVNLDPGYLETSKLILASTKNFSHRIYLNGGIWGELTLLYSDGGFQTLPWTYPDYKSREFLEFLSQVRESYKAALRK